MRLDNDAHGGWTTRRVLDDVTKGNARTDVGAAPDLVVTEIGANDFHLSELDDPGCSPAATSPCWAPTLSRLRTGLIDVVDKVRALDRNPDLRIVLIGYWNIGRDGQVARAMGTAYVTATDQLTRRVNAVIADVARQEACVYIDAYAALKGELGTRDPTDLLLDDGDHPNASGHTLLADAILVKLQDEGALTSWSSR